MQLKEHINILLGFSLIYSVWATFAIFRNDLGLRDRFMKSFIYGDVKFALFIFGITLIYGFYILTTHNYDELQGYPHRKRLIKALKTALISFMIAFFAHMGMWIAPFFFTLVIELI